MKEERGHEDESKAPPTKSRSDKKWVKNQMFSHTDLVYTCLDFVLIG